MASALRERREERHQVLSLQVLAGEEETERRVEPTQFRVLVRHFLERFFTNEMASADGDAKTRLVQVACALGIPGLIVAMYLYPVYHLPRGHVGRFWGPRPYWSQAGDHYFYVVYSLVALGLVTIFEWDLLFPDLLDVFVMGHLPVRNARMFAARVTAIAVLLGAALFDVNFLAPLVLPAATDPPHLFRFWAAHMAAVGASGVFGAALFLALEGVLLGVLGDRWFRRISLWLQGVLVAALLTLLFLYPAMAGSLQGLTAGRMAAWVPSFWFLGIYERVLHGSTTLPIFVRMAQMGWAATCAAVGVAVAAYPLAWWRRTRGLVEGAAKKERRSRVGAPMERAVHATLARTPACRAMWQFIGQNLVRVPRYRMVLVMVGGMGAALVLAAVTRVSTAHGRIAFVFSPEGLRAVVPMVAFWTVSGLRSTFLAPADQRGRWIFRVTVGKAGLAEVGASRRWVLLWSAALSLATVIVAAWTERWTGTVLGAQTVVAVGWSVVLTDLFFLNVKTIPFTGAKSNTATNFALLLIPYLGFFPAVVLFTVATEPWVEATWANVAWTAAGFVGAHLVLRTMYRQRMHEHLLLIDADEDEEEFPQRLGLRY
ncbi:MAG TPA: hypothetical protein VFE06_00320 [Acidobacteriaceae bacterium]|jgi:hypothetical protein|nr:hypothetical protein [Acidobacteriaceae bacterium]